MATKKRKIDPNEWYSLMDLVKIKAIPWAKTYWSIKKLIDQKRNQEFLKVIIRGKGTNTKYYFKGSHVINFVNQVESGEIRIY